MRTETITKTIYKFDELPKSAQETVIENWRCNDHFHGGDEWQDSLKGFQEYFPVTVIDWEVSFCSHSYISFRINNYYSFDNYEDLKSIRLWKYINNNWLDLLDGNCPFTGVCFDENLLDAIRNFHKNPNLDMTFDDLMQLCLDDWVEGYKKDMEYWYTAESIKEDIEGNEHEFYENGSLY